VRLDAVILAGGRASRLGGAAKPDLRVGDSSLLEHATAAATRARARHTIIVGPERDLRGVHFVREDPPHGGPVAALAAALHLVESEWLLLLAADLPRATSVVDLLLAAASTPPDDIDGVALIDADGRPQWLAGLYRTTAIRHAIDGLIAAHGTTQDSSLHRILSPLTITLAPDPDGVALDVDTWQDISSARSREEKAHGTL